MNSKQDRPISKISYEKPTAVDLGPAAPVAGGSCVTGEEFTTYNFCYIVGNGAFDTCSDGNDADEGCLGTGSSPGGNCSTGTGV